MTNWYKEDLANAVHKAGSLNCPNCGAPINEEKCPFCGTLFVDFAAMDADKPFFMKIKHNGEVFIVKVRLTDVSMHTVTVDYCIDGCGFNKHLIRGQTEMTMDFVVVE